MELEHKELLDTGEIRKSLCAEVRMTPEQCNVVIEDKLTHLLPILECALASMKQVSERLANGEISWRKLLQNARRTVELYP